MRIVAILTALFISGCANPLGQPEFSAAQQIVDEVVANHPRLVRLTIHAVAEGTSESRIIASNVDEKIGQFSDPEDLAVMKSGESVILREGENLDVTMPIVDREGRIVAATGITLSNDDARSETTLIEEANLIAGELTSALQQQR